MLFTVTGQAKSLTINGYKMDSYTADVCETVDANNQAQAADKAINRVAAQTGKTAVWVEPPVVEPLPIDQQLRAIGAPTLPGLE